jgi:hypothetical protein
LWPAVIELVRDQVRQRRDVSARQKRLENLLISAYQQLPQANHLDTIPGIGGVTAAVLTAFMLDCDRFETPGKLVAYFGILPIEASSGVDRDGTPRGPKRFVMSRRGNDLVRRYLWMAALSAIRCNPAARALYARVVAKHPDQKAIAVGHVMRKLLHLAFAIWKTNQPFDEKHYPWQAPAHVERRGETGQSRPSASSRRRPRSCRFHCARRFVQHVLPKGFLKIRHYGLLASRHRQPKLQQSRQLLAAVNLAAALACAELTLPRPAPTEPAQAPHCPHCGGQRFLRLALPKEMPPPAGRGDTS